EHSMPGMEEMPGTNHSGGGHQGMPGMGGSSGEMPGMGKSGNDVQQRDSRSGSGALGLRASGMPGRRGAIESQRAPEGRESEPGMRQGAPGISLFSLEGTPGMPGTPGVAASPGER